MKIALAATAHLQLNCPGRLNRAARLTETTETRSALAASKSINRRSPLCGPCAHSFALTASRNSPP